MNKLLLLALLGCAMALAATLEEEEQSLQSFEGGLVRDVRDADPGRKNNKRKNNKRKNKRKMKKRKNNKRKNNKVKNNKRKNNKGKNNKGKNNKKRNNKRKNNKRKNNKRKNNKGKNNKRKNNNGRQCLATTCVDNAVTMMSKLTKIANYKTQAKRITSKKNIADKKAAKSTVFAGALQRLTTNAGGNSSAPMCGTSADNAGAVEMKSLIETLGACEADVVAACSTSASLAAPNATEVSACEDSMAVFEAFTEECKAMTGAEGCTCWEGNDDVTAALDVIKMCNLADKNTEIVAAVGDCKSAFGACKKSEDAVASIISSCSQDPDQLKTKLKNLQANSDAVGDVQDKIASALATRSSTKAITSGAIFIESCGFLIILIGQDPSNFGILAMAVEITTAEVTFTAADLEALLAVSEDMDAAADALAAESAAVLATYEGKFQTTCNALQ
jgi:hypothetical protein